MIVTVQLDQKTNDGKLGKLEQLSLVGHFFLSSESAVVNIISFLKNVTTYDNEKGLQGTNDVQRTVLTVEGYYMLALQSTLFLFKQLDDFKNWISFSITFLPGL